MEYFSSLPLQLVGGLVFSGIIENKFSHTENFLTFFCCHHHDVRVLLLGWITDIKHLKGKYFPFNPLTFLLGKKLNILIMTSISFLFFLILITSQIGFI